MGLERYRIVWSSFAQMLVLVVVTAGAYYHAFFDVARADQFIYLYDTAGQGLWALTIGDYDLNRKVGDVLLFRPVLYELLGLERWAWGYHFMLWQATSIALHVAVVLSLYAYCRQRLALLSLPRPSATPFVLALFFALLFAGTEMVAWHHLAGYLLFCLLFMQGALAYQRLVTAPAARHAVALILCLGLACFTYELGNVAAAVFAAMLLYAYGPLRSAPAATGRRIVLATALILIAEPCAYALWSWLDYPHGTTLAEDYPPFSIGRFLLGEAISAGYWLDASLWPPAAHLIAGGRIHMAGGFPRRGELIAFDLISLGMAARAAVLIATRRRTSELANDHLPALGMLLLAAAYTAIIVAGRSLSRGTFETLGNNTYYAYIFALLWLLALFHLVLVPAEAAREAHEPWLRRVLLAGATVIAIIGGVRIYGIHATMQRQYTGPMATVIARAQALRAAHAGEPDFSFDLAANCPAITDIPWFASYMPEKLSHYSVVTALFPDSVRSEHPKYLLDCR